MPRKKKWLDIKTGKFDEHIAFNSFRYCLGRHTYVVSECVEYLIDNWEHLGKKYRELIYKEIQEYFATEWQQEHAHECDNNEWNRIILMHENTDYDSGGRVVQKKYPLRYTVCTFCDVPVFFDGSKKICLSCGRHSEMKEEKSVPMLSIGEPSTLGTYLKLAKIFGQDAVDFIKKKIEESPNREDEVVVADETQMIYLLSTMLPKPEKQSEVVKLPTVKCTENTGMEENFEVGVDYFVRGEISNDLIKVEDMNGDVIEVLRSRFEGADVKEKPKRKRRRKSNG